MTAVLHVLGFALFAILHLLATAIGAVTVLVIGVYASALCFSAVCVGGHFPFRRFTPYALTGVLGLLLYTWGVSR